MSNTCPLVQHNIKTHSLKPQYQTCESSIPPLVGLYEARPLLFQYLFKLNQVHFFEILKVKKGNHRLYAYCKIER